MRDTVGNANKLQERVRSRLQNGQSNTVANLGSFGLAFGLSFLDFLFPIAGCPVIISLIRSSNHVDFSFALTLETRDR